MKAILSFILVSVLAFSATADIETPFDAVIGFVNGLKYAELSPAIENCSLSIQETKHAFGNALFKMDQDNEQFDLAFQYLFANTTHALRACSKIFTNLQSFVDKLLEETRNLSSTELGNHFFANMFNLNMKFTQMKSSFFQGDFKTAGAAFADIFKMIAYGNVDGPSRTIRQLFSVRESVAFNINATYLGFLGFLEEANTTIAMDTFILFSNDTSKMADLANTLQAAIRNMDFATAITTLESMRVTSQLIFLDFATLNYQFTRFFERDLPLFDSAEQLQKVSQYMFANLPATMMNFQRIMNAYKNADYRELGHGAGALYNQLRAGAMSSF